MPELYYCPLCGYHMHLDYDGHLLPCIVKHMRAVSFRRIR